MKSRFKQLWREPLVHFLSIGAVLFLLYGLNQKQASEAPKQVVVNSSQVEQLAANFKRSWMRPPSNRELDALVENHIREEIFYREALALGLDQDDPIVRRRMRQKLEFSLETLSTSELSDQELSDFMHRHQDKFRTQTRLSFQQVYLDPRKHSNLEAHAKSALSSLLVGAAPEQLSDPTLMPSSYQLATQNEIARVFGERFSEAILTLNEGDWLGPLHSPFGGHLVKITQKEQGQLPELDTIRDEVTRELLALKRVEQLDVAYQRMREGYQISIDPRAVSKAQAAASNPIVQIDRKIQ